MPARDGTGPYGTGSVGRGLGPCSENQPEYDQQPGLGLANRWGKRYGNPYSRRGWKARPYTRAADSEIQSLQNRKNRLQEQLANLSQKTDESKKASE